MYRVVVVIAHNQFEIKIFTQRKPTRLHSTEASHEKRQNFP
jgi:hypothetical protein